MQRIQTEKAPRAIGPYSQAILSNGFVFVSGQIPINPEDNLVVDGTIEEQTEQVIKNLMHVLEAAESSLDKAVKVTVYLADMNDFAKMNEIYARYFTQKPARACVEVARLPKDVRIEMDVVAEQ